MKGFDKYEIQNFKSNLKLENFINATLQVYICDQIRYISKEDFIRYVGVEPTKIETIGSMEIIPIDQEEINKICKLYSLKAQLNRMKSKERENNNSNSQKREGTATKHVLTIPEEEQVAELDR